MSMSRISEILRVVGRSGLVAWNEIHAIQAAVEVAVQVIEAGGDDAEVFKTLYGTLAVETLRELVRN